LSIVTPGAGQQEWGGRGRLGDEAALDLPVEEGQAWIAGACGSETSLRTDARPGEFFGHRKPDRRQPVFAEAAASV